MDVNSLSDLFYLFRVVILDTRFFNIEKKCLKICVIEKKYKENGDFTLVLVSVLVGRTLLCLPAL
jgi:hypothetical protein